MNKTTVSYQDIVEVIRKGDFSEPNAVYKISIPKESFSELIDQNDSKEIGELSDTLKDYIHSRMSDTIINRINACGGTKTLAATSILSGERIFVNDELSENVIYLYTYESAVPVAFLFIVGEDGAVLASGRFILYDGFNTDSKQEIEDSFEAGLVDVEVEVIVK